MTTAPTNGTNCATREFLKLSADIRNEAEADFSKSAAFDVEARRDAEVSAFINDVVTLADTPAQADFLRRAMHNVYIMGRTHEAIDGLGRLNAIGRKMVEWGV